MFDQLDDEYRDGLLNDLGQECIFVHEVGFPEYNQDSRLAIVDWEQGFGETIGVIGFSGYSSKVTFPSLFLSNHLRSM
jgi:hypothetical protein